MVKQTNKNTKNAKKNAKLGMEIGVQTEENENQQPDNVAVNRELCEVAVQTNTWTKFNEEMAVLEALREAKGKEEKVAVYIKRQLLQSMHIRKLTEQNSKLRKQLEANNAQIKQILNDLSAYREKNKEGMSAMKIMGLKIGNRNAEIEKSGKDYEKEKTMFFDKLAAKDAQIAKQNALIKELTERNQEIISGLESTQFVLKTAQREAFLAYKKEEEAIKNLNDKLFLAEKEQCRNCKQNEEKQKNLLDRVAKELKEMKMDNIEKNRLNEEQEELVQMQTIEIRKLEAEKNEAEHTTAAWATKILQMESALAEMMEKDRHAMEQRKSIGTQTMEELTANDIDGGIGIDDEIEVIEPNGGNKTATNSNQRKLATRILQTDGGKQQLPPTSSKSNSPKRLPTTPTKQHQTQTSPRNVAITPKKRPFAKPLGENDEGKKIRREKRAHWKKQLKMNAGLGNAARALRNPSCEAAKENQGLEEGELEEEEDEIQIINPAQEQAKKRRVEDLPPWHKNYPYSQT